MNDLHICNACLLPGTVLDYLAVLGIEPRASCMLDRSSTTEPAPSSSHVPAVCPQTCFICHSETRSHCNAPEALEFNDPCAGVVDMTSETRLSIFRACMCVYLGADTCPNVYVYILLGFKPRDQWLRCLSNTSKRTWPPSSPSVPQLLPGPPG